VEGYHIYVVWNGNNFQLRKSQDNQTTMLPIVPKHHLSDKGRRHMLDILRLLIRQ
jgi:hypothetical protein